MDCQEARPSSKLATCSFLLLVLSSLLCSIFLTVDEKSQIWGSCRDLCRCPTFAVWLVFFFTSFRASRWARCVIFAGQPLLGAQQPYIPPLWIKLSFCSSMNTHKKAFNFFSSHLCASLQCTMLLLSCESTLLWSRKGSHMSALKKSNQTSPLQPTLPVGSPDLLEEIWFQVVFGEVMSTFSNSWLQVFKKNIKHICFIGYCLSINLSYYCQNVTTLSFVTAIQKWMD